MLSPLKTVLAIILAFFCTGCYGASETNALSYIMVFAADKAADGKQKITCQLAIPSALGSAAPGGMESKTPAQKKTWTNETLIVENPEEFRMLLSSTLSRKPDASHAIALIISEEAAREGLAPLMAFFSRSRDFHETTFLFIVPGSAEEYVKQNKPALSNTLFRYYENFLKPSQKSFFIPTTYHEFYRSLKNSGSSPYTAYSAINPLTGEAIPAGSRPAEQTEASYLAGGIPRSGLVNPAEFIGLAVFRSDKMVGTLNSDETRAVSILQGHFFSGYLGVVDPLEPQKHFITLNIYCYAKPKISVTLQDNRPTFLVKLNLEAEILGITSGINYEAPNYRSLLETQTASLVQQQILAMLKHTQALGTDPVGFGLYLRPQFYNTAELSEKNLLDLYQQGEFVLDVSVRLRRTGLIWRTTPERKG